MHELEQKQYFHREYQQENAQCEWKELKKHEESV